MKTVLFAIAALLTIVTLVMPLFPLVTVAVIAVYLVISQGDRYRDFGMGQCAVRVLIWGAVFTALFAFRTGSLPFVFYSAAIFGLATVATCMRHQRYRRVHAVA